MTQTVPLGSPLARIVSVNVGGVRSQQSAGGRAYPTAIAKVPVAGRVRVGPLGLEGDAQANLQSHGGPDQAVHAHFTRRLREWGALRGREVLPGEIGENLTLGAPPNGEEPGEAAFCIGDVVAVGSARLQVTQPRVPCFKQADRLGVPDAVAVAKAAGRTGFYLRVLAAGEVGAGDDVVLIRRPHPGMSIALVNRVLHGENEDREARAAVAACAELGARLRPALK